MFHKACTDPETTSMEILFCFLVINVFHIVSYYLLLECVCGGGGGGGLYQNF